MFPPKKKVPMAFVNKKTTVGISPPPSIGGMGRGMSPEPDADDMGGPPDNDMDDKGATLSPETVGYHEEAHNCGNCKHNQGGNCEVIGQQVADEGGCSVWEDAGAETDTGMDMSQEPAPYPS
jgi:hypothetical protein